MRKNQNGNSQQQNKKGRVLARVLSEELRYVQGGYPYYTDTQSTGPHDPGDTD